VSDKEAYDDALGRLNYALSEGLLSGASKGQAEEMAHRLQTGVRVAVIGPKGSGKTQLCTVLLNCRLPDPDPEDGARIFVPADGVGKIFPVPGDIGPVRHVPVRSAALAHMQLTDVAGAEAPSVQAARIRWALASADLILWCEQGFDDVSAALWAEASDMLKDHSFLVLTAADKFAGSITLAARIDAMQAVANEEFHSFFPTSAKLPFEALCRDGEVSEADMATSGIKALAAALRRLVDSGRTADLDRALLFLQRQGIEAPESVALNGTEPATPRNPTVWAGALDLLRSRVAKAGCFDIADDAPDAAALLEVCTEISDDLNDLAGRTTETAPDHDLLCDEFFAANDRLVLLSLECDVASAADAVTVLLQISRDLESRAFH
jgi:hypothetical protein